MTSRLGDDVEFSRQRSVLDICCGGQLHQKTLPRAGVRHPVEDAVPLVQRMTFEVHLGGPPSAPRPRYSEVDVRGAAWIGHELDGPETESAVLADNFPAASASIAS